MKLTEKDLLSFYDRVGEPSELHEFAAAAAARELAANWQQALQDGDELAVIINDVDAVVRILKAWKAAVADKGFLTQEV